MEAFEELQGRNFRLLQRLSLSAASSVAAGAGAYATASVSIPMPVIDVQGAIRVVGGLVLVQDTAGGIGNFQFLEADAEMATHSGHGLQNLAILIGPVAMSTVEIPLDDAAFLSNDGVNFGGQPFMASAEGFVLNLDAVNPHTFKVQLAMIVEMWQRSPHK
jgi:hypothetical protein